MEGATDSKRSQQLQIVPMPIGPPKGIEMRNSMFSPKNIIFEFYAII